MALTNNVFILCVFCFTLSFLCSLPYIVVMVGVISVIGGCWGCWGCSGFTLLIVFLTGTTPAPVLVLVGLAVPTRTCGFFLS